MFRPRSQGSSLSSCQCRCGSLRSRRHMHQSRRPSRLLRCNPSPSSRLRSGLHIVVQRRWTAQPPLRRTRGSDALFAFAAGGCLDTENEKGPASKREIRRAAAAAHGRVFRNVPCSLFWPRFLRDARTSSPRRLDRLAPRHENRVPCACLRKSCHLWCPGPASYEFSTGHTKRS